MERNYNEMAFVPEEVEQGLHLDLIKHLLDYSAKSEKGYYDIHITSDGYCTIVEWVDKRYNDNEEQGFRHLDYDEVIMKEVYFPDGHYEFLFPNEVEEVMEEWQKENPNYVKNEFGMWTDKSSIIDFDKKGE